MKAIILCAGKGKRLRPITNKTPKCLLPINGRVLLDYWLANCEKHGVKRVLINGHYLSNKLEAFILGSKKRYSLKINYVYEPELLGTGGTIKTNYDFIKNEKYFFLFHGDNFTNLNITEFRKFHEKKGTMLTLGLFRTNKPDQCGIIEKIERTGRVIKYIEKPKTTTGNLANAALFILSPNLITTFPPKKIIDFSKEIIPLCVGKMYGYEIDGFNIDIGTPSSYQLAQKIAKEMSNETN